jgi:DNA segregation ATPase FtsK/SpoIIIE, S-DNA-T family
MASVPIPNVTLNTTANGAFFPPQRKRLFYEQIYASLTMSVQTAVNLLLDSLWGSQFAELPMALHHSMETDESTIPAALRRFLRRRAFELAGLSLVSLIILAGLAVASWSPTDPSFNHATAVKPHNWLGYPGAFAADQMMQLLGLGVLAFLFIPLKWAILFFRHETPEKPKLIVASWLGASLALSSLFATLPTLNSWPLAGGLGGNIGDVFSGSLLSILSIGIKGLIAKAIIFIVSLFATYWTLTRALNLNVTNSNEPAPAKKKLKTNAKPTQRDNPLANVWSTILAFRPKAKSPKDTQSRRFTADPSGVLSRFAPVNLKKNVSPPADEVLEEEEFEEDETSPFEDSSEEDIYEADEEEVEAAPVAKVKTKPPAKTKLKPNSFELPPLELLSEPKKAGRLPEFSPEFLAENARRLEGVLEDFGVRGQIINVRPGPVVTLYELEPAPGIKSSRVISLADDIARSMSAISARVAVVQGRNAIGIELPNPKRETVYLRELMQGDSFIKNNTTLSLALGKNIGGEPIFADLARMPHLLIAGTTGSGKSVGINTMILSLLYRLPPDKCKLIMIDPKMLELSVYEGIPHLLAPVVTDPRKAVVALKWAVREMEDRYKKMSKTGVRNVDGYNAKLAAMSAKGEKMSRTVQTGFDPESGKPIFEQEEMDMNPMPYIVVIIDEMADLMMVAGKDIEGAVQRLAQMARAAGIHVVMATQRPSVDVITGTIKANFPTRISFQVTSKIDSRTILGEQGAEQLLGQGDMLYMAGGGRISRLHAPFVTDSEVESIVNHLKAQGAPEYVDAVTEEVDDDEIGEGGGGQGSEMGSSGDALYDQAVAVVLRDKKVSTSYVQRRLQIGYNKAASLIERMEKEGLISSPNAQGKREILVPGDSARV